MPVDVSPLAHIEVVVRDADLAADVLARVFGATRVQEDLVAFLNESFQGLVKVVHVELGQVVLQFVEPLSEDILWAEHLRTRGPGVHNLTFGVASIQEAASLLAQEGAPTLLTFGLDWAKLAGPDAVRENAPPVHIIGSEEIIGFRLELNESPPKPSS
jgi:hypothetical protein